MEQFKRARVIMLPTENKINSLKGYKDKSLLFQYKERYRTIEAEKPYVCNYHLYIISDDEIKEDDWRIVVDKTSILYGQFEKHLGKHECNDQWKKIIATTDTSLNRYDRHLPQPSQQFIAKYIESYNKDEVITDVLVEYEEMSEAELGCDPAYYPLKERLKLKVNPKDNTITIKKLKDSWNREDLHKIAEYFYSRGIARGRGNLEDRIDCNQYQINKYINETL